MAALLQLFRKEVTLVPLWREVWEWWGAELLQQVLQHVYQAGYIENKCEIKLFNASECCRFLRMFSSIIAPSLVKMKWVRCWDFFFMGFRKLYIPNEELGSAAVGLLISLFLWRSNSLRRHVISWDTHLPYFFQIFKQILIMMNKEPWPQGNKNTCIHLNYFYLFCDNVRAWEKRFNW